MKAAQAAATAGLPVSTAAAPGQVSSASLSLQTVLPPATQPAQVTAPAQAPAVPASAPAPAAPAPVVTVGIQCSGGAQPPLITGGPDVVPYASLFTGGRVTNLAALAFRHFSSLGRSLTVDNFTAAGPLSW